MAPLVAIGALLFAPAPIKWFLAVMVPFGWCMVSFLLWLYQQHSMKIGPCIVADLEQRTIHLPYLRLTFDFDSIVHFQWIAGSCSGVDGYSRDLNLIVTGDDEMAYRYHVIGEPYRKEVRRLAETCDLAVVEVNLGRNGFRDIDQTFDPAWGHFRRRTCSGAAYRFRRRPASDFTQSAASERAHE